MEVDDEHFEDATHPFQQPPGVPSRMAFFNALLRLNHILAFTLKVLVRFPLAFFTPATRIAKSCAWLVLAWQVPRVGAGFCGRSRLCAPAMAGPGAGASYVSYFWSRKQLFTRARSGMGPRAHGSGVLRPFRRAALCVLPSADPHSPLVHPYGAQSGADGMSSFTLFLPPSSNILQSQILMQI